MNQGIWRLTALAAAALLAACNTITVDAPVTPDLPLAFAHGQAFAAGDRDPTGTAEGFDDPVLQDLIREGLAANLDLRQAAERVQRSRALADAAHAARAPDGAIGLGHRSQQLSRTEAPGLDDDAARRGSLLSVQAGVGWEVDLFGRLRRAAEAATARTDAVVADAEAMRLAVGAEIAQVWFLLDGLREQRRVAQTVAHNRRSTLDLVLRRVGAGYSAGLDEARARADLAAAEAELPAIEASLAVAGHRLAVLLGRSPSDYEPPSAVAAPPRPLALRVPDPATWAAARPDLRAAEARLRAHALDVAAVRAEFLPRVSIAGVLGFVAGSVSGLGAAGSASWFVVPSISVPVFDAGRIDARLRAAQADQRQALLHYRQRILLATEEVENALVQVRRGQFRLVSLQQRARHASEAESLARKRYEAGGADLLELLEAQRTVQQAELGLATALTAQRQQVVALQRALGTPFGRAPVSGTPSRS